MNKRIASTGNGLPAEAGVNAALHSVLHSTTAQSSCQGDLLISRLLGRGPDNAQTAREIARILQWPTRLVTQTIQTERLHGSPIIASCDARHPGYYLPASASQVDEYCRRLQHREREISRTRKAVASTLQQRMIFAEGGERDA